MSRDPFLERKAEKYLLPIPSREFILCYLAKQEKPVSHKELTQKLDINNKDQLDGLRRRLRAMERDGQLIFTRRQYYILPERINMLRGTVIGHRDGFGFLRVEGHKDDYYLSVRQMQIVIHGDIVLAKTQDKDHKNRREARILRILVPKNSHIIGRFFTNDKDAVVVPEDNRLNFNILIPLEMTYGATIGSIVAVELTQRPTTQQRKAIGKIVEVLGNNVGTNMAVDIAVRTHDIPYFWPAEVKQQLNKLQKKIPETIKQWRVNLCKLPLVTIDGENAQDFDDAIYCEKKSKGGWRLWVAIADVSYYVRPHTPLDQEASRRATSVYFPSQVIPMLPETLSNDLCSLRPQADRLCMVCEMTISVNGHLASYKFYEAIINSHARLTYNKVWKILNGQQDLCIKYAPLIKSLKQLHEMYQILEKAKLQRGGISFKNEEVKFIFNAEQRIKRIELVKHNDAHKLVEECMILANTAAARFVERYKEPTLYRVHDRPSNEQMTSLRAILVKLGLNLGGGDKPSSKDYANIINQIANRPDHEIIQIMLLRSMKPAIYDPENRGHFGLALKAYAHFTSPIRRYPDLMLHRTIKYLLNQKNKNVTKRNILAGGWHSNIEEILKLGQQCSINERRADEAIRNVADWLKCDFMQNYIRAMFNGIITNVTNFGFFVRLHELFIDGLVHVSSLDNDYYHYDNINQQLIGESSGAIYQLGDLVQIRVETIHMNTRKIIFTLISSHNKNKSISKTSRYHKHKLISSANKEDKLSY